MVYNFNILIQVSFWGIMGDVITGETDSKFISLFGC